MDTKTYDVLVLGGDNAALCAAITAREAGRSVLLLECAPRDFRGATAGTPETCAACTTRLPAC